jgi:hypothetical protein
LKRAAKEMNSGKSAVRKIDVKMSGVKSAFAKRGDERTGETASPLFRLAAARSKLLNLSGKRRAFSRPLTLWPDF